MIPLLYLFHRKSSELDIVRQYISANMDGNPEFFEIVGGNHFASKERCNHILEKYNNRMITF